MIRAIFFDFDGVLTTDKNGWYTTCKNIQRLIPSVPLDRITECYLAHNDDLGYGKKNHSDMWDAFCTCVGTPLDISVLEDVFLNTPWNTPMFDIVRDLKKQGYRAGIITDNNMDRFNVLTKAMCLDELFDSFALSATIGSKKDQPEIFEAALRSLNVSAEESVFIDNTEKCLVVPKKMGFKAYLHNHELNDVDALRAWLRTIEVNI